MNAFEVQKNLHVHYLQLVEYTKFLMVQILISNPGSVHYIMISQEPLENFKNKVCLCGHKHHLVFIKQYWYEESIFNFIFLYIQ